MSRQNNSNGGQNNSEVDELFEVKTYFYIGAYQQCLNEINKLRVSEGKMMIIVVRYLFFFCKKAKIFFCSEKFR